MLLDFPSTACSLHKSHICAFFFSLPPPYAQVIVMTVVISLLYYAGGSTSQQEIQNLTGALFFITLFLAFNGVFQARFQRAAWSSVKLGSLWCTSE